jgi:hypothetical protein
LKKDVQVVYLADKIPHDNIERHNLQNYLLSSKSFFNSQRSQNSNATYFGQVSKSTNTSFDTKFTFPTILTFGSFSLQKRQSCKMHVMHDFVLIWNTMLIQQMFDNPLVKTHKCAVVNTFVCTTIVTKTMPLAHKIMC